MSFRVCMAETVGLNPLDVDGTQVGVFKQTKYASLASCRTMTASSGNTDQS